ncbi:class I SAM-dependent methyltransferase [Alphaproteobacteria bacterium]|nr:class I SAM-dependent methyltransferase [Alphaproteobacteria bacterium]
MNKNDFKKLRWKNFHKENDFFLKNINKFINKRSGWKLVNKCPICDSERKKILFKKFNTEILNCLNCNHIYSYKIPKKIKEAYSNSHHQNQSLKSYDSIRKYRINRFAKERINLILKYKKKGNFLDYGCGTGWLIEHAKTKFKNIEGYEPTKELSEITSKKLDINVFDDFKNRRYKKYDIITLYDVIEHVINPKSFINDIHKIMNKNSLLVIYTPNSNSLSFNYLKEKSNLVIPPLHLHFFNYDSLNYLIKRNFKILHNETKGFDIADIYSYQLEKNIKTFVKNFKDIETIQDNVDNMFLGNHIRFILKKR